MTMLNEGAQAPSFSVTAHDGSTINLADHEGRYILLWWYPKADTPG